MAHRTVFLFPGLASFSAAALGQVVNHFPEVLEPLQDIDRVAKEFDLPSVSKLVLEGRGQETAPTAAVQLATFGISMALHNALVARGVQPDVLVGHSFGELAALTAAGAFSVADGARVVCHRVAALADWEDRGGILAVGVDAATALHMAGAVEAKSLVIACRNSPRQTALSGPLDELQRVIRVASVLDVPTSLLDLPYPSHHPLMAPAVPVFLTLCSDIERKPLHTPVYSPMHNRYYAPGDDVLAAFSDGITLPVDFLGAVRRLHEGGAHNFVEVGGRRALTRSVERTIPDIHTSAPLAIHENSLSALHTIIADLGKTPTTSESSSTNNAADSLYYPASSTSSETSSNQVPSDRVAAINQTQHEVRRQNRDALVMRLRKVYANTLEYPLEEVTEDIELESELGVDSLKQVALLSRIFTEQGLPAERGIPLWEYRTIGQVADMLLTRIPGGTV